MLSETKQRQLKALFDGLPFRQRRQLRLAILMQRKEGRSDFPWDGLLALLENTRADGSFDEALILSQSESEARSGGETETETETETESLPETVAGSERSEKLSRAQSDSDSGGLSEALKQASETGPEQSIESARIEDRVALSEDYNDNFDAPEAEQTDPPLDEFRREARLESDNRPYDDVLDDVLSADAVSGGMLFGDDHTEDEAQSNESLDEARPSGTWTDHELAGGDSLGDDLPGEKTFSDDQMPEDPVQERINPSGVRPEDGMTESRQAIGEGRVPAPRNAAAFPNILASGIWPAGLLGPSDLPSLTGVQAVRAGGMRSDFFPLQRQQSSPEPEPSEPSSPDSVSSAPGSEATLHADDGEVAKEATGSGTLSDIGRKPVIDAVFNLFNNLDTDTDLKPAPIETDRAASTESGDAREESAEAGLAPDMGAEAENAAYDKSPDSELAENTLSDDQIDETGGDALRAVGVTGVSGDSGLDRGAGAIDNTAPDGDEKIDEITEPGSQVDVAATGVSAGEEFTGSKIDESGGADSDMADRDGRYRQPDVDTAQAGEGAVSGDSSQEPDHLDGAGDPIEASDPGDPTYLEGVEDPLRREYPQQPEDSKAEDLEAGSDELDIAAPEDQAPEDQAPDSEERQTIQIESTKPDKTGPDKTGPDKTGPDAIESSDGNLESVNVLSTDARSQDDQLGDNLRKESTEQLDDTSQKVLTPEAADDTASRNGKNSKKPRDGKKTRGKDSASGFAGPVGTGYELRKLGVLKSLGSSRDEPRNAMHAFFSTLEGLIIDRPKFEGPVKGFIRASALPFIWRILNEEKAGFKIKTAWFEIETALEAQKKQIIAIARRSMHDAALEALQEIIHRAEEEPLYKAELETRLGEVDAYYDMVELRGILPLIPALLEFESEAFDLPDDRAGALDHLARMLDKVKDQAEDILQYAQYFILNRLSYPVDALLIWQKMKGARARPAAGIIIPDQLLEELEREGIWLEAVTEEVPIRVATLRYAERHIESVTRGLIHAKKMRLRRIQNKFGAMDTRGEMLFSRIMGVVMADLGALLLRLNAENKPDVMWVFSADGPEQLARYRAAIDFCGRVSEGRYGEARAARLRQETAAIFTDTATAQARLIAALSRDTGERHSACLKLVDIFVPLIEVLFGADRLATFRADIEEIAPQAASS